MIRLTLLVALTLSTASCAERVVYRQTPPPIPPSLYEPVPQERTTATDPVERAVEAVVIMKKENDRLRGDRAAVRCIVLRETAIAEGKEPEDTCEVPTAPI